MTEACSRTHAWLERCVNAHQRPDQALFGIVQGGCWPALRAESARVVAGFDLPGIAVGGVSVGEPVEEMHRVVRQLGPLLPEAKPHYLMGVGSLREMAIAVAQGFDLFDCVLPTRLGRHGAALVGANAGTCATPASATTTPPRSLLPLPGLPEPQPCLPAPPDPLRGDAGPHPAQPPQPHHPAAVHASDGPGDRRGVL